MLEPKNVDAYIDGFSGEAKARLELMRSTIRAAAPDAKELISYGLVGYKYLKKPLVYFGGFARHTGFYATPNGHEAFAADFAPYKQGKGSVQFPHDQPLPIELIRKVVTWRVHHIQNNN